MKRDPRLHRLSRDHHHALVLARFIKAIDLRGGLDADVVKLVKERFASEVAPHFDVEEMLLSALEGRGVDALVERTRLEHARMTHLVEAATAAAPAPLTELAHLLTDHVRFEERELYPACEEHLPTDVLDHAADAPATRNAVADKC